VRTVIGQCTPRADEQPGPRAVQARNAGGIQLDLLGALKFEILQRRVERSRFVDDPVTAENQAQSGISALGPVPGARVVLGNFAQSIPLAACYSQVRISAKATSIAANGCNQAWPGLAFCPSCGYIVQVRKEMGNAWAYVNGCWHQRWLLP